jgi:hypothetical protein
MWQKSQNKIVNNGKGAKVRVATLATEPLAKKQEQER